MADWIHKPWIENLLIKEKCSVILTRPRRGQISHIISAPVKENDFSTCLHISDKELYIKAFLSQACVKNYFKNKKTSNFVDLRGSFVNLRKYMIETVVDCDKGRSEFYLLVEELDSPGGCKSSLEGVHNLVNASSCELVKRRLLCLWRQLHLQKLGLKPKNISLVQPLYFNNITAEDKLKLDEIPEWRPDFTKKSEKSSCSVATSGDQPPPSSSAVANSFVIMGQTQSKTTAEEETKPADPGKRVSQKNTRNPDSPSVASKARVKKMGTKSPNIGAILDVTKEENRNIATTAPEDEDMNFIQETQGFELSKDNIHALHGRIPIYHSPSPDDNASIDDTDGSSSEKLQSVGREINAPRKVMSDAEVRNADQHAHLLKGNDGTARRSGDAYIEGSSDEERAHNWPERGEVLAKINNTETSRLTMSSSPKDGMKKKQISTSAPSNRQEMVALIENNPDANPRSPEFKKLTMQFKSPVVKKLSLERLLQSQELGAVSQEALDTDKSLSEGILRTTLGGTESQSDQDQGEISIPCTVTNIYKLLDSDEYMSSVTSDDVTDLTPVAPELPTASQDSITMSQLANILVALQPSVSQEDDGGSSEMNNEASETNNEASEIEQWMSQPSTVSEINCVNKDVVNQQASDVDEMNTARSLPTVAQLSEEVEQISGSEESSQEKSPTSEDSFYFDDVISSEKSGGGKESAGPKDRLHLDSSADEKIIREEKKEKKRVERYSLRSQRSQAGNNSATSTKQLSSFQTQSQKTRDKRNHLDHTDDEIPIRTRSKSKRKRISDNYSSDEDTISRSSLPVGKHQKKHAKIVEDSDEESTEELHHDVAKLRSSQRSFERSQLKSYSSTPSLESETHPGIDSDEQGGTKTWQGQGLLTGDEIIERILRKWEKKRKLERKIDYSILESLYPNKNKL
eukprot:gene19082-20998_t